MIVYRIAKIKFKEDITGLGPKLYGSRWNTQGLSMLYTAEHISLAVLETLVHLEKSEIPVSYWLLTIKMPDNTAGIVIDFNRLKKNWAADEEYTQFMGSQFLTNNESLFLKVPSAVINEESNFLLNPIHKDFKKVQIIKTNEFNFDTRLLSFK